MDDIDFGPGDRVSERYTVRERIGRGGMGVVYHAHDGLINEEVALKFMKPQLLRTARAQQSFLREAQVARKLRHENIVGVHDAGQSPEGLLYISMEFLKGRSLRRWLSERRAPVKLPDVRFVVSLLERILAALEYAHRTVVHRDIKPENVMLLPGEGVKVLDFGLAKAVQAEQAEAKSPAGKSKRVIGTLAYAAPEQVRRVADVDHRADLYAVGLLFYELLTLRTPMDEQVPVTEARGDVSPSLLEVYERAVEEDRTDRWQTAAEFRHALTTAFRKSYRPVVVPNPAAPSGAPVSTDGMVFLEGGNFVMGDNDYPESSPEHELFVEPFYMDEAPVTNGRYQAYVEATGAAKPRFWDHTDLNGDDQPVTGISWQDAADYATWAGKRLPTEAQWEYAARGREGRTYPWGKLEPEPTRCNYRDYLGMPSIVTMHEEGMTPEGIKDMAGNVFEWTLDPFAPYDKRDSEEAANTPLRVVRGGSWHSGAHELRCTYRKGLFPESRLTTVGFRCVLPARAVAIDDG